MPNLASSEALALSEVLRAHQTMTHLCNHFANETSDSQLKQLCQTMIQDHDAQFHRLASHISATNTH